VPKLLPIGSCGPELRIQGALHPTPIKVNNRLSKQSPAPVTYFTGSALSLA